MLPFVHITQFFNERRTEYCRSGAVNRLLCGSVAQGGCVGSVSGFRVQLDTLYVGLDTFVPIMLAAWNQFYHHFMNNTTLQLHVWRYFQLSSVVFRFELQQVILTVVYMSISD